MKEWLAYLLTEAPDGPVIMVAPNLHAIGPDIIWPIQELAGHACRFNRRTMTGIVGGREIVIINASDPWADRRLRGMRLAGAWRADLLDPSTSVMLNTRLLPGARRF